MYEKSNGRPCVRGDGRARTAISGHSAPPATARDEHVTCARLPVSLPLAGPAARRRSAAEASALASQLGITDLADVQIVVASWGGTCPDCAAPENPEESNNPTRKGSYAQSHR
jgi:hypothetical protein